MALVNRPNGNDYFASHPSIDPDLGALIDAELNILFSGMNSIDNANIDGTPKIDASKIDLTSGGYVEDTGDEITGILQHIFDTVSGQSFWRAMRASGNARIYEGVADGLWCISQNTFYTGSVWSGRDLTGVCWAVKLESDGFHVYYAASANSGVVPSWTEVFHADADKSSLFKPYTVGDYILYEHTGANSNNNTSYEKRFEIRINRAGTYRVKHRNTDSGTGIAYTRIYKNGSAFGGEHSNGSDSYIDFSEDLTFAAGDLIQLYAYQNNVAGSCGTSRFWICVAEPFAGRHYSY